MTRLVWDAVGDRDYETGVDRGIFGVVDPFYTPSSKAWSGLVSVNRDLSGAEPEPLYYDGRKRFDAFKFPDYKATVTALSVPTEISECEGNRQMAPGVFVSNQRPTLFNFGYRTMIGDDVDGLGAGYKLHFVYNVTAVPTPTSHTTVSDSPEPTLFSWTFYAVPDYPEPPNNVLTYRPTAYVVVDSRLADPTKLANLENLFWGSNSSGGGFYTPTVIIGTLD